MSRIDELIKELCPEGVETRELGDVITKLRTGLNPRKNFRLNQPNAFGWYVTVRELAGFSIRYQDKTDRLDNEGLLRIQERSQLQIGDVLISGTGTIGRTALVESEPSDWNIKEGVYALTPDQDQITSRFLIYLFGSGPVVAEILLKSSGSTVKSIPFSSLRTVRIAVPPLPVQHEIVRILDTFTELKAELEAELEARTTQYEETRNRLMAFDDAEGHPLSGLIRELCPGGVPEVSMGKAGRTYAGLSGKTKADFGTSGSRYVSYMVVANNLSLPHTIDTLVHIGPTEKQNQIAKGDVLLTGSSEDLEGVGLACEVRRDPETPTFLNSFCIGWRPENGEFAEGFLGHVLASRSLRLQVQGCANGVTRMNISRKRLEKVRVPLPPLAIQEEIVRILDAFDLLVSDLSAGLPAEIAARSKQYEYYRDKLLSFEDVAA